MDAWQRMDIFIRAREILAGGWTRASGIREGDAYSMGGALELAALEQLGISDREVTYLPSGREVSYRRRLPWDYLCDALRLPAYEMMIDFCDAPSTRQEDVLDVVETWCVRELRAAA